MGLARARLFVDARRLGAGVRAHLGAAVEVAPYDAFFGCLAQMGAEMAAEEQKGVKRIDFLMERTIFAGLSAREDGLWRLHTTS